ncbi:MAG: hypothetical protein H6658_12240 [Ardenticatenaceae bacterium]|nr:hypothetical protein [Ardenticatenaceae bacterium]
MKKISKSILIVLVVSLTIVPSAFAAYIDPNSGGLLFQMLAVIVGLLSGLVLLFSSRIKMLLARISRYIRERGHDQEETNKPAE